MFILYLSHLEGSKFIGPSYSVPKQIESQSKLDDVFWYNGTKKTIENWCKLKYYHDKNEYKREDIGSFPKNYSNPDLVVVEGFYNMAKSPLMLELIRKNIPYIIIPRGELTYKAQKSKSLKKSVANFLLFNRYAKKAIAIQYLTEQEYKDSGDKWNKNHIVIPNGTDRPNKVKTEFSKEKIKCVSIGRIALYPKGLDILVSACSKIKEELISANVTIDIYGPDRNNNKKELELSVKEKALTEIISIHDGIYDEEKSKVLLDHDVFLMPSRFEGHPMALIEALAYGLPCVATKGSNMKEEIAKYDCGWTADTDEDSLCQALLAMIREKDLICQKSENAKLLAQKYNWNKIANQSHETYLEILKK